MATRMYFFLRAAAVVALAPAGVFAVQPEHDLDSGLADGVPESGAPEPITPDQAQKEFEGKDEAQAASVGPADDEPDMGPNLNFTWTFEFDIDEDGVDANTATAAEEERKAFVEAETKRQASEEAEKKREKRKSNQPSCCFCLPTREYFFSDGTACVKQQTMDFFKAAQVCPANAAFHMHVSRKAKFAQSRSEACKEQMEEAMRFRQFNRDHELDLCPAAVNKGLLGLIVQDRTDGTGATKGVIKNKEVVRGIPDGRGRMHYVPDQDAFVPFTTPTCGADKVLQDRDEHGR
mmetsp:Transcript_36809/g.111216  ORF Transcript_36809/g.111216 Transcript_36809/m.111216 type:complete len:291 (-) Transcript_36809:199-1071(-)